MQSFDDECREIDSSVNRTVASHVTSTQVDDAKAECALKHEQLQNAQNRLTTIVQRKELSIRGLAMQERILQLRKFCDDTTTRVGALIVVTSVFSGIVVIASHLVGLRFPFAVIPLLAGLALPSVLGRVCSSQPTHYSSHRSALGSWIFALFRTNKR